MLGLSAGRVNVAGGVCLSGKVGANVVVLVNMLLDFSV